MTDLTQASLDQNTAADPGRSTWLSANAGSGKTRVLTDRVARLLLHGVNPQSILCLTFTKAAATEMQNRLFKRLGEWAMLDDGPLRNSLAELGEAPPDDLDAARTLFASAIETPGGLKIQTIHSFCSALLRQFPLEAGVSPQFTELDDAGKTDVITNVLDSLAEAGNPALFSIAHHYTGETLSDLAAKVAGDAEAFPGLSRDQVYALFDADPDDSLATLVADTFPPDDWAFLKSLPPILATSDKSTDHKLGDNLAALPSQPNSTVLPLLETLFLFGEKANSPFAAKTGTTPTKAFRNGPFAPYAPRLHDIMEQVEAARARRLALVSAEQTWALHDFAAVFLPAYAAEKDARGVLDFDDLIRKARDLLTDDGLAWVLYRLDGGIDHVLVDEAQDTSPTQWQVISALTAEITSGQGARTDRPRSIFVVGDKKQSIYSFQGADARGFDRMFAHFKDTLAHGPGLQDSELVYSFRSSPAILHAVDFTFADANDSLGPNIVHRAFHEGLPGRVDLWPLEPRPDKPEETAWHDPVDLQSPDSPVVKLAQRIAGQIKDMLENGSIPGEKGKVRRIEPRDILILVRGRGSLFDTIISACKHAKLPMAGADRLKVGAELAVRDILSLLSFLALPEDDLALATALRSPLFGWSEPDLFTLAHDRPGHLWAALRNQKADYPDTFDRLTRLRKLTDFKRPYELIEAILGEFGGRAAFLTRLGAEAEDGLDELLNQALAYERAAIPSLTGFVAQASAETIDIKRQSDTTSNLIRVMTVHGAKGLEAPIVILPDTMRAEPRLRDPFLKSTGTALWSTRKDLRPPALRVAADARSAAELEELDRLLYVAMTRAAAWLIVCGTEPGTDSKTIIPWHTMVETGLKRAAATPTKRFDGDDILRLEHGSWPENVPISPDSETEIGETVSLAPLPQETIPARPVSPSDLGGAKALPGDSDGDKAAAMDRGTAVHRLLEVLPAIPEGAWITAASRLLPGIDPTPLLAEARAAITAHPDVFVPDSLAEVDIATPLPGHPEGLVGAIDRLIVTPTHIRAIDFKTNSRIPDRPENTPDGLLRQMGAYLAALEQIWPDRNIDVAILWTAGPTLMSLPHGIVRDAFARTTTS